jgi:toxin ParE1/3/4
MSLILRRAAVQEDLKEIWKYIASRNPERADLFLRDLNKKIEALAANPWIGRERGEIMSGLRSFPFKSYIIFYFPLPDGVDLVRVLHGARYIDAIFYEE